MNDYAYEEIQNLKGISLTNGFFSLFYLILGIGLSIFFIFIGNQEFLIFGWVNLSLVLFGGGLFSFFIMPFFIYILYMLCILQGLFGIPLLIFLAGILFIVLWLFNIIWIIRSIVKCGKIKEWVSSQRQIKMNHHELLVSAGNWQIYAILALFLPIVFPWILSNKTSKAVTALYVNWLNGNPNGQIKQNTNERYIPSIIPNDYVTEFGNTTPQPAPKVNQVPHDSQISQTFKINNDDAHKSEWADAKKMNENGVINNGDAVTPTILPSSNDVHSEIKTKQEPSTEIVDAHNSIDKNISEKSDTILMSSDHNNFSNATGDVPTVADASSASVSSDQPNNIRGMEDSESKTNDTIESDSNPVDGSSASANIPNTTVRGLNVSTNIPSNTPIRGFNMPAKVPPIMTVDSPNRNANFQDDDSWEIKSRVISLKKLANWSVIISSIVIVMLIAFIATYVSYINAFLYPGAFPFYNHDISFSNSQAPAIFLGIDDLLPPWLRALHRAWIATLVICILSGVVLTIIAFVAFSKSGNLKIWISQSKSENTQSLLIHAGSLQVYSILCIFFPFISSLLLLGKLKTIERLI